MEELQKIIERIHQTRKYKALPYETISRVVSQVAQTVSIKQTEQHAKKKLHQIWGAYYSTRPDFKKLEKKIHEQSASGLPIKESILPLLAIHASVKERIPILDIFYKKIFAITGNPGSIIDHASGLNALTFPWMLLPDTTNYTARDIDAESILFINNFFKEIKEEQHAKAKVDDLFSMQNEYADIHFLFKVLPLLEQQQKGKAQELLQSLKGNYIVVSYPIYSLSGNNKGMREAYSQQCEEIIHAQQWIYTKIEFATELVYVIEKHTEEYTP